MGIKARRILATNVADVQQIGGTGADARRLLEASAGRELGDIEAEEIIAANVGVFQHIREGAALSPALLLRELTALRAELEVAAHAGELPAAQARPALEAAKAAEAELAGPAPDKEAAKGHLGRLAEGLKKASEASENVEKLGGRLVKLAPAAMALWKLLGGLAG